MLGLVVLGVLCDVDAGSKPARDGVFNALRFWLIVSSMEERDARRKSAPVSVSLHFAVETVACEPYFSRTPNRPGRKAKLRRQPWLR